MASEEEIRLIRRGLAAATMRQVQRLFDAESVAIKGPMRNELLVGSRAAAIIAQRIAEGSVEEKEWEFLAFLAQPKADSPAPPVNSAENPSSGSKNAKAESAFPSIPSRQPNTAPAAMPASRGRKKTS